MLTIKETESDSLRRISIHRGTDGEILKEFCYLDADKRQKVMYKAEMWAEGWIACSEEFAGMF